MTIEQLINEQGIDFFFDLFGWQGGTIHQVRTEIKKRLANRGIVELKDTKELVSLVIEDNKSVAIENYMATKYPNVI